MEKPRNKPADRSVKFLGPLKLLRQHRAQFPVVILDLQLRFSHAVTASQRKLYLLPESGGKPEIDLARKLLAMISVVTGRI
jgi:hypothetical protein